MNQTKEILKESSLVMETILLIIRIFTMPKKITYSNNNSAINLKGISLYIKEFQNAFTKIVQYFSRPFSRQLLFNPGHPIIHLNFTLVILQCFSSIKVIKFRADELNMSGVLFYNSGQLNFFYTCFFVIAAFGEQLFKCTRQSTYSSK